MSRESCPGCGEPVLSGVTRAGVDVSLDPAPGTAPDYFLEIDGDLVEALSAAASKKAGAEKRLYRAHRCKGGA